jgi:hypothetical protein
MDLKVPHGLSSAPEPPRAEDEIRVAHHVLTLLRGGFRKSLGTENFGVAPVHVGPPAKRPRIEANVRALRDEATIELVTATGHGAGKEHPHRRPEAEGLPDERLGQ